MKGVSLEEENQKVEKVMDRAIDPMAEGTAHTMVLGQTIIFALT
jgi:hypothetical protein